MRRYFAYGSNMCADQMAQRCPAAVQAGIADLKGWQFAVNRRGVATLIEDRNASSVGLLWDVTHACEASLDRYEGVAAGHYRKTELTVAGRSTLVYLAADSRPGMPRLGYLERILAASCRLGVAASEIATWARPVQLWLVNEVLANYRLDRDGIHGLGHWLRVRANGLALATRTPGANADVIELFALLHDSCQHDDYRDTGHGERSAGYVKELANQGLVRLAPEHLDQLIAACSGHDSGDVSADATIGCCWDADRLELSRLGRRPKTHLLSTEAARDVRLQAEAWQRGQELRVHSSWLSDWGLNKVSTMTAAE